MRAIFIGLISLLPLTMFAASSAKDKGNEAKVTNIKYVHQDNELEFSLDYNLTSSEEKAKKLMAAKSCKKYLTNQLLVENEKYDRLTMERIYSNGKKSNREIKTQIKKQLKTTMDLLSDTEAVADYISWLRS